MLEWWKVSPRKLQQHGILLEGTNCFDFLYSVMAFLPFFSMIFFKYTMYRESSGYRTFIYTLWRANFLCYFLEIFLIFRIIIIFSPNKISSIC